MGDWIRYEIRPDIFRYGEIRVVGYEGVFVGMDTIRYKQIKNIAQKPNIIKKLIGEMDEI